MLNYSHYMARAESKKTSKSADVKDTSGFIDEVIDTLKKKGRVRVMHFGEFRATKVKGRKVYKWETRKMVPVPPFIAINFTAANGLNHMFNPHKKPKA